MHVLANYSCILNSFHISNTFLFARGDANLFWEDSKTRRSRITFTRTRVKSCRCRCCCCLRSLSKFNHGVFFYSIVLLLLVVFVVVVVWCCWLCCGGCCCWSRNVLVGNKTVAYNLKGASCSPPQIVIFLSIFYVFVIKSRYFCFQKVIIILYTFVKQTFLSECICT